MYIHTIILNDLKPNFKLLFVIVFFTISSINSYSQSFELKIYSKDSADKPIIDAIDYKKYHLNKKSILKEIDSIALYFSTKGFINNQYILEEKDSLIMCDFSLNKRINIIRVYYNDINLKPELLKRLSINFNNQYFETSPTTIQDKLTTITKHYEKQGFTFVKASLKDLNLKNSVIEATLNLDATAKRTIDTIIIRDYDKFPEKYLKHYLEIKKNTVFNNNFLTRIQAQINTIPFVSQIKNPEVLFTKDSTALYLYLSKQNINQFEGVIGFSNSKNNSLTINGFLNLNLNNIFDIGEQIDINWKNNGDKNTSLKINLNTPYILKSKFSLNGSFNIYRKDTIYNSLNTQIALIYSLDRNHSIKSIANHENSTILGSANINGIESYTKKLYGISYLYQPQAFLLKNKLLIELNYLIGTRNTSVTKRNQSKGLAIVNYLWNLNSKNQIFIKNTTEILNTSKIFENELFLIGGINSIRGFDDQSILTSNYNLTNLEYIFYTTKTNYLYTISDFG
ncbi:MAG: hypothetical protein AB1Z17_12340, partial [Lutibacter sp.]